MAAERGDVVRQLIDVGDEVSPTVKRRSGSSADTLISAAGDTLSGVRTHFVFVCMCSCGLGLNTGCVSGSRWLEAAASAVICKASMKQLVQILHLTLVNWPKCAERFRI